MVDPQTSEIMKKTSEMVVSSASHGNNNYAFAAKVAAVGVVSMGVATYVLFSRYNGGKELLKRLRR